MNPRTFPATAIALAIFAGALLLKPAPTGAQTGEDFALMQLVNDVSTQQATISDNQAKIDAKLAAIGENIRLARIYVGRGGGKVP